MFNRIAWSMAYMKNLCKGTFLVLSASILLMSGCGPSGPSEPDTIVWRSAFIPDEWEEDVLARLGTGTDYSRFDVAEARQINEFEDGRVCPEMNMFAVVAAYNKKSGRLVARWGYSPNPKLGENGLEVTITNLTVSVLGQASARHPVGFQLSPDFSSLTMSWGPRLEKRGALMHMVKWNRILVGQVMTTR